MTIFKPLVRLFRVEQKIEGEPIVAAEHNANFNEVTDTWNENADILENNNVVVQGHIESLLVHISEDDRYRWDRAAGGGSVQSNYTSTNEEADEFIRNKPNLMPDLIHTKSLIQEGNTVDGNYANALGVGTEAVSEGQTVAGKFNSPVDGAMLVIGCGTSDAVRRNAMSVNNNGDTYIRGNITAGGSLDVASGGTGGKTASDARVNLGLGSVATESILPVAKGGTGGETTIKAKEGLGILYGTEEPNFIPATGEGTLYFQIFE